MDFKVRWSDNTKELAQHLAEGLNQIEATRAGAEKMAQALSGDKLIGAAHRLAAAIQEVGGVQKLTSAEQERAHGILTKAIEKYEALGRVAPTALRGLAEATKQVEAPTSRLAGWFDQLGQHVVGTAAGFVSAQAVIGAVSTGFRTLTGFVQDSVKAYGEAEAAQTKMIAALKAQHTATPEVIQQYNELATQFQKTTVFSDDLINNMQGLLVQVGGVMPSKMEGALKASTDLASGLGVDLQTATMLVAKAAAGHTETLGKYGITVSDAALQTKGFEAVLEAINRQFGGQAAAALDTYTGKLEQVKNAWNNVQEAIGKMILSDPLIEAGLRNIADAAQHADESSSRFGFTIAHLADQIDPVVSGPLLAWMEEVARQENEFIRLQHELAGMVGRVPHALPQGLEVAPPSFAELSDSDKVKMARQDATKAAENLTAAQKQAALAAFAHGQSVEQTTKILEQYWPAIDKSAAALSVLKQGYDKSAEAQKQFDASMKNVAAVMGSQFQVFAEVDGAVIEGAKALMNAGASMEDVARIYGLTSTQVKAIAESEKNFNEVLKIQIGTGQDLTEVFNKLGTASREFDDRPMGKVLEKMAEIEHSVVGIGDGLDKLGSHAKPAMQDLQTAFTRTQKVVLSISESLKKFPNLLIQAFTGGGDLMGAIKGLATTITDGLFGKDGPLASATRAFGNFVSKTIGKVLGDSLGNIIGSALKNLLPGLGGLLAPLFDWLMKLGGPNEAQTKARSSQQDALSRLRASATKEQLAEVAAVATRLGRDATDIYSNFAIIARDAFLKAGYTAEQTDEKIQGLLDTEHPERFKAALADLNRVLDQNAAKEKRVADGVDAITEAWNTAGRRIPEATREHIRALLQMNGLTDEQRQKLQALLDTGKPTFEQLKDTASKYGITLEGLGPKFRQLETEDAAAKIYDDFMDLKEAGGDVGGILLGMSDEISQLVQDSIKFGTAIPDNMRPLIENLIQAGKLVDENGQAITDLTLIHFEATPLAQGIDKLNDAIDRLVQVLEDRLPKAIEGLPDKTVTIDYDERHHSTWLPDQPAQGDGLAGPSYAASGGLVTAHGIVPQYLGSGGRVLTFPTPPVLWRPRGTDTVPAMLTPGETVLPKGASAGGVQVTVNISVPGGFLVDEMGLRRAVDDHLVPQLQSAILRDVKGIRRSVKRAAQ